MIQANELRIGNWLIKDEDGLPERVSIIYPTSVKFLGFDSATGLESVSPIPLTPEWIERAGFELFNTKSISEYSHKGCYGLKFTLYNGYITVLCKGVIISELKHVHQLQNLYFALTGQELEFK